MQQPELVKCQCLYGNYSCRALATQEDLLCDGCRRVRKGDGACVITTAAGVTTGHAWADIQLIDFAKRSL